MKTVKDDTYYESRIREELHKLHKLETKLAKRLLVVSSEEEGEVTLDYLLNVSSYVKDVFIDTEDELVEILGNIDDLAEEMADDLFVSPER